MSGAVLPPPPWAQDVLRRLDELPTVLRQQETIGRLLTTLRGLHDERDGLNRALEQSRADLHAARHEVEELQKVIIDRLKGQS